MVLRIYHGEFMTALMWDNVYNDASGFGDGEYGWVPRFSGRIGAGEGDLFYGDGRGGGGCLKDGEGNGCTPC